MLSDESFSPAEAESPSTPSPSGTADTIGAVSSQRDDAREPASEGTVRPPETGAGDIARDDAGDVAVAPGDGVDEGAEPHEVADPYVVADPYEAPDPYEGAVPPGYDWPTHGGYLGCLMGLMAACILGGFLGSLLVGFASVSPLAIIVTVAPVRIAIILMTFVATMFVLGRVGWRLGRRFYREYPQPQRTRSVAAFQAMDEDDSAALRECD